MSEKNYCFRLRHWQYHRLNMRNCERMAQANEILLDESWKIGCCKNAGPITRIAVEQADACKRPEACRSEALGHFIRNSIITCIHIKKWYQLNIALVNSPDADVAGGILDKIESLAHEEIANANDTIAAVECDSRLGWEPSMEYVCDKWHLEWKIRQVNYAVSEIQAYRKMLFLHKQA